MRPPNNGNRCEENPENNIYEKQVKLTKFYWYITNIIDPYLKKTSQFWIL